MSHFVTLIFGDDYEKALDPFWELDLTQEDAAKDYRATFNDCTAEVMGAWENDDEEQILINKEYFSKYDKQFRTEPGNYTYPEGSMIKRPIKECYSTPAQYAKDYYGYGTKQNTTGEQYGYWSNANAKWDWVLVGGRWTGYFKVKEGVAPIVGTPGIFNNTAKAGYTDQCRIKDIDFDGMFEDSMKKAMGEYDKFEEATSGIAPPPTWEHVRTVMFPDDITSARNFYNMHPWVVSIRKANLSIFGANEHAHYFVGNGGRDAFVENSKCTALLPFAIILEGKWYEKGSMGWWGMVSDEKTQYDWSAKFAELWETLDPNTIVTVCDCHI